jgi:tetratricopeptide (TPR) repeat protein
LLTVLLLVALLGGAAALAGRHLWAWHEFRAGAAALARDHTAEARAHLGRCLQVWPSYPPAHLLAARAARRAQAFDEAERHLEACQPPGGKPDPNVALEGALLQAAMGDLDPVEEDLVTRADKDEAQAPLIREALTEGYLRMYRIRDALGCLEAWLASSPDDVRALALRARVYRQVGQSQKAVPDYQRVVELDPSRDDDRWGLAVCLLETGRYEEALTHLEYLRPRRPGDPDLVVRVARCQDGLGRPDEARQTLDAVLAEHPDCGQALRVRGQLALQDGRPEEAEPWLRRAAAALPYDYPTQWALYQALNQAGRTAEADAQKARAERLKDKVERLGELTTRLMPTRPNDPALHSELGTLLLSLGHKDLGERWLYSALRLDPDYGPAHAALADYYQEQGDTAKAAEHRRQAQPAAGGPKSAGRQP